MTGARRRDRAQRGRAPGPADLAIVDAAGVAAVEPGVVDIWVASGAADPGVHVVTRLA